MIEIEIKDYVSTDQDKFWDWKPEEPTNIFLNIDLYIGPKHSEGAEIFQCVVATPKGLSNFLSHARITSGRHYFLIERWNWDELKAFFENLISTCQSEDWAMTSLKLSRHFKWEYEDHSFQQDEDEPDDY